MRTKEQRVAFLPTARFTVGDFEVCPFVILANERMPSKSSAGSSDKLHSIGDDFKVFAWVTEDVFEQLKSESGIKQLIASLGDMGQQHTWSPLLLQEPEPEAQVEVFGDTVLE